MNKLKTFSYDFCKQCENNNMYEDNVSGDIVCTDCGLVCNVNNHFNTDFHINETQNTVYIDTGNIKKEVIFLIKRFKMNVCEKELTRLVSEWICFAKTSLTVRFLTCAIYLQINSDKGSIYLTNDLIQKWSKKIKISFIDLQKFLKRNCNSAFFNEDTTYSNKINSDMTTLSIEEWIKNLQQTTKEIIQTNYPSYDRKLLIKVNDECRRIVTTKKETLFHNLHYVSAAIIYKLISKKDREFDKNIFKILNKKKVLKIKRLIYN